MFKYRLIIVTISTLYTLICTGWRKNSRTSHITFRFAFNIVALFCATLYSKIYFNRLLMANSVLLKTQPISVTNIGVATGGRGVRGPGSPIPAGTAREICPTPLSCVVLCLSMCPLPLFENFGYATGDKLSYIQNGGNNLKHYLLFHLKYEIYIGSNYRPTAFVDLLKYEFNYIFSKTKVPAS